jgi:hypothetical protein
VVGERRMAPVRVVGRILGMVGRIFSCPAWSGCCAPYSCDFPQTVPNVLSLLRLAGVPLFLWLLLGPRYDLKGHARVGAVGTDGLAGRQVGPLAELVQQVRRIARPRR